MGMGNLEGKIWVGGKNLCSIIVEELAVNHCLFCQLVFIQIKTVFLLLRSDLKVDYYNNDVWQPKYCQLSTR
jgi:hypothetical protein